MAPQDLRQRLIIQVAALVTTMYAFFLSRVRANKSSRPRISYALMSDMDEERQRNLDKIYNYDDVEYVNMLCMRRAPFSTFVTCSGKETCLGTTFIVL